MKDFSVSRKNRRGFLSFLAGSPLFASTGLLSTLSQKLFATATFKNVLVGGFLLAMIGVPQRLILAQGGETTRFVPVMTELKRPDFQLNDLGGSLHSIGEWDGRVLLIDFWASWCIPCRKEMPAFNELRAKYLGQDFEVIGVAADHAENVEKFLSEVQVDFPVLFGDVFKVMGISAGYGNNYGGLPFNVFIDRDGNVRYVQKPGEVTFEEAEEILKRLL